MNKGYFLFLISILTLSTLSIGVRAINTDISYQLDDNMYTLTISVDSQVDKVEIIIESFVYEMVRQSSGSFTYSFDISNLRQGQTITFLIYLTDALYTKSFQVEFTPQTSTNYDILSSEIFSFYIPIFIFTALIGNIIMSPLTSNNRNSGEFANE